MQYIDRYLCSEKIQEVMERGKKKMKRKERKTKEKARKNKGRYAVRTHTVQDMYKK